MNIVNSISTPEDLLQQGNQLKQAKKLDEAIAMFQQTIELQSDNVWAYQYWGETLVQKGDLKAAEKCYIQGIKASPDFALHYHCLAQVLFWQENIIKSLAVSHKAIALEPNRADFHYQLGQALIKQGKLDSAINSYQRALELSPDMAQARQKLTEAIKQQKSLNSTAEPHLPLAQNNNKLSVFIGKQHLTQIYSASIKLFISPQNRQAVNFLTANQQISIYEYQPHPATTGGVIVPLGAEIESELVEMQLAPTFCLGFLITSQQQQQHLNSLTEWWRSRCQPEELPPYLELKAAPELAEFQARFWQLMFERSVVQTGKIAQRISTLQKQYLNLRTLHENMQNAFAVVEDYLSQAKLPGLQLAFEQQPESQNIALKSESAEVTIKQLLPISSRSIAAVEIHLAQVYDRARGTLAISLKTPDNEQFLANWAVPYSHLSAGWLKLDVPQIDLGYQKDVVLLITGITDIGPAPSLSLSKTQLIPEACLEVEEVSHQRSLALRLWKGLPGTHRVISPYTTFTSRSTQSRYTIPQQPQQGYLGQRTMSGVVEITPNLPQDDFPHLEVIEEGRKILTHPRETGAPTIAMLPFCLPPTANRVVATVATEHPEAGVIEYAMAVIEEGIEPLTCLEAENLPPTSVSSGWVAIDPDNPHQIYLSIPPAEQHRHLVIAAKLPTAGSFSYAWARWLNFWLE